MVKKKRKDKYNKKDVKNKFLLYLLRSHHFVQISWSNNSEVAVCHAK